MFQEASNRVNQCLNLAGSGTSAKRKTAEEQKFGNYLQSRGLLEYWREGIVDVYLEYNS